MIHKFNIKRFFYKSIKQPRYALKVFIRRLFGNIFYYTHKAFLPESITLFLTYRCNLSCKMCGQWGDYGITKREKLNPKEELDFNTYKNLINNISFFKPNITLFGGEPLLYPQCIDLIRYIKSKKMHCVLITNGFLLEDFAKKLVESNLDELNISIDGPRDLHDSIRGHYGLFDRITSGIELINKIKKDKLKKPLINIQCTITKYNYERLEEMLDVAYNLKANSITFHHLIFLSEKNLKEQKYFDKILDMDSKWWKGFMFSPDIDIDLLYKKIKEIKSKKYSFSLDFYPDFSYRELLDYYSLNYDPKLKCLSPWMVSYIFPDGRVLPCLNYSYSFGNIKDSNFLEIWNNKEAIYFRKILKKYKRFKACLRCTELYRY